MPNLPVAQVQGVTAIYSADGNQDELEESRLIFARLGMIAWCETEEELGIIGAVASAGIAYVARFAEALGHSATTLGIHSKLAALIAEQTLVGTGAFAAGLRLPEITRRVAAPGGTPGRGLQCSCAGRLAPRSIARSPAAIRHGQELAPEAARRLTAQGAV
jgi:pyrroline-5-carboxylate reductase